jgi:hypothetical protein
LGRLFSVLPDYQDPKVGDWMPMARKVNETTTFRVLAFEPNQWLVWESRTAGGRGSSAYAWRDVLTAVALTPQHDAGHAAASPSATTNS